MHAHLLKNDKLYITPMSSVENIISNIENYSICGYIHYIEKDQIYVRIDKDNINTIEKHSKNIRYHIHFAENRSGYQLERYAVEVINRYDLSKYFFPEKLNVDSNSSLLLEIRSRDDVEFKWFNKNIMDNREQIQAVKNIFNAKSYPAPFLLFGPLGTGKTNTIVEAICQLWKLAPTSNILVCTASNSACDEIAIRLLKYIPKDQNNLFRIYAASVDISNINEDLMETCNIELNTQYYPPLQNIYKTRIVFSSISKQYIAGIVNLIVVVVRLPTKIMKVVLNRLCNKTSMQCRN